MAPTPKGYTTKAEVEDFLFADLDPAYEPALDRAIVAAEQFIERKTRRRFDQPEGPLTVSAPDVGQFSLVIPDTRSLTSVTLAGPERKPVTLENEGIDWLLEPAGAPDRGRPYTRLVFLRRHLPYPGTVTLHGEFGWDEIPAEVRMAATLLVTDLTRRWRNELAGDVSSYSLGDFSQTFATTFTAAAEGGAREFIKPFVKPRVR